MHPDLTQDGTVLIDMLDRQEMEIAEIRQVIFGQAEELTKSIVQAARGLAQEPLPRPTADTPADTASVVPLPSAESLI